MRKCPMCKMVRMTDEMRKHPNHANVRQVTRLLNAFKDYDVDLKALCEGHWNPMDNRNSLTLMEHWRNYIIVVLTRREIGNALRAA